MARPVALNVAMEIYWTSFIVLVLTCMFLEYTKGSKDRITGAKPAFYAFRNNYLIVYSLMMGGDWLQGPYVYALYQHYGYTKGDIGKLFIAGFGSSMVFGTIVGSLGDKFGRKTASLLYVATYVASCATKHSPNFGVLMVGRLLGGIATSLLFSAFESWLVAEHFKRGHDAAWLSDTFSKAVFLGNGLVAILAGLLANFLVKTMGLGPVAPFDASAVVLLVGGTVIAATWTQNYGEVQGQSATAGFRQAIGVLAADPKVALLGAVQSLFEGAMYTFVFLWTPALSPNGEDIPHGFIFAIFMVACMVGSSLASRLLALGATWPPDRFLTWVFSCASALLLVPVLVAQLLELPGSAPTPAAGALGGGGQLKLIAFVAFEVCVGIFWPSIMKLRSQAIPEECRSTILNLFRVPLNLFVCIVLYNVGSFPIANMFGMCSTFLALASFCMYRFQQLTVKGSEDDEAVSLTH
eukprot:jgi/Mesvir1/16214/Mv08472-RA.1